MSTSVTFRMPKPMLESVVAIEESEDKSRTAVILELINEALKLRQFKAEQSENTEQKNLKELEQECGTKIIMEMYGLIGDMYRSSFDKSKSKFKDMAETAEQAIKINREKVNEYINGRIGKK